MTNFLVKHIVHNYQDTEDLEVRTAYGILAGVVGIFCNLFLFAVKFISGSLLHSVAVTADAFNNFSDAGSSIISLVGVKMAEKPADRDHPFGHRADRVHRGPDRRLPGSGCGLWLFQGFL